MGIWFMFYSTLNIRERKNMSCNKEKQLNVTICGYTINKIILNFLIHFSFLHTIDIKGVF